MIYSLTSVYFLIVNGMKISSYIFIIYNCVMVQEHTVNGFNNLKYFETCITALWYTANLRAYFINT